MAAFKRGGFSRCPIVFEMGGDPVALGIVPSLSQPGGNLTGVSSLSVEVGPKRLESLHEVIPTASVFAVAVNPTSPTANWQLEIEETADALGLRLHVLHASAEQKFEQLFTRSPELGAGGLVFTSDPVFAFRSQRLARSQPGTEFPLSLNRATSLSPAGYELRRGLVQSHRQAGVYAGRVLKGEKPSDLTQLVTTVEFFNLKTARNLDLTVPTPLLARADEVIE